MLSGTWLFNNSRSSPHNGECDLWEKLSPRRRATEGRPPLLTRLRAGKSLIFIQSVPLPFLRKAGRERRPSAFYCVLILGSIICCNECALGRVTFTLILDAPEESFLQRWIKGPVYCKSLPLFLF